MKAQRQTTCADLVDEHAASRFADLAAMIAMCEHGLVDGGDWLRADMRERVEALADAGQEVSLMAARRDEYPLACGNLYDYALSFDYVAGYSDYNEGEGYWRYQISWGGPSDEVRFYGRPGHLGRAEYWYMDWFDGAHLELTGEYRRIAQWLFDWFDEAGTLESTRAEAEEE